jgi:hypothetical protein
MRVEFFLMRGGYSTLALLFTRDGSLWWGVKVVTDVARQDANALPGEGGRVRQFKFRG